MDLVDVVEHMVGNPSLVAAGFGDSVGQRVEGTGTGDRQSSAV